MILGNSTVAAANPDFSFGSSRKTAVVHEMSHALGAVQDSAPHTDGAGHCTDGSDVMCDAGGAGCADAKRMDCGGDDYFGVAPASGSYLATHRNLYDSTFMCELSACFPGGGQPRTRAERRAAHPARASR